MENQWKILGVDVCEEALRLAFMGEMVSNEHLSVCPICQRRMYLLQADTAGWEPISHRRSAEIMETMVANFVRNEEVAETNRTGFYAHLAKCEDCEGDFACMVAAALAPAPEHQSPALAKWIAELPARLKAHREEIEKNDSATEDSQ